MYGNFPPEADQPMADNHVQFWPACAQGFGGQANCHYTTRSSWPPLGQAWHGFVGAVRLVPPKAGENGSCRLI